MLHVNIGKRKMVHWSLFCDESLAGFDALSVVEPYIYEDLDTGERWWTDELRTLRSSLSAARN